MRRTLRAILSSVRRSGPAWLPRMAARIFTLRRSRFPRGLMIEPTTLCDGGCPCCVPSPPAHLMPEVLHRWLGCLPAVPATFAFVGKHSDPLCCQHLDELARAVRPMSLVTTVSTIGTGLRAEHTSLPVDRWIVSVPGATGRTYAAVRGRDRLAEVLSGIRRLSAEGRFQVEVALTLWRPSAGDAGAFLDMARAEGWKDVQITQGIYDPTGFDVGRPSMLATDIPGALFAVDGDKVERRARMGSCPAAGYLFMDAAGILRPCRFSGSGPSWEEPSRQSWLEAARFEGRKASRPFPECRWCP